MVLGRVRLLSHSQGPMELCHMGYMEAIWGLRALDRLWWLWRPYNWPEEWLNERTTFQYIFNGGITSLKSFPSCFKAFSKRLPKSSIVEHSAAPRPFCQSLRQRYWQGCKYKLHVIQVVTGRPPPPPVISLSVPSWHDNKDRSIQRSKHKHIILII